MGITNTATGILSGASSGSLPFFIEGEITIDSSPKKLCPSISANTSRIIQYTNIGDNPACILWSENSSIQHSIDPGEIYADISCGHELWGMSELGTILEFSIRQSKPFESENINEAIFYDAARLDEGYISSLIITSIPIKPVYFSTINLSIIQADAYPIWSIPIINGGYAYELKSLIGSTDQLLFIWNDFEILEYYFYWDDGYESTDLKIESVTQETDKWIITFTF